MGEVRAEHRTGKEEREGRGGGEKILEGRRGEMWREQERNRQK